MDAPTWWADVQQDRDNLAGRRGRRQAEVWLQEDLDFVPRRRLRQRGTAADPAARRTVELSYDDDRAYDDDGADHPLHGVFVPAAGPRVIELVADPLDGWAEGHDTDDDYTDVDDDGYLAPPPPPGQRRTVRITGRPSEANGISRALRHRPRTAADRIGPRPDRIALWAVVVGAVLIILAILSSSSQAAEIAHHASLLPR